MENVTSTTWDVNHVFEKFSVDPTCSGSFTIKIREIERTLCRSPSGLETLVRQEQKEPIEFVSETPSKLIFEEERCTRYVANVLSKTKIESSVQHRIAPKISKDAINIGRRLRQEEGSFLVKADVEVVKETSFDNFSCIDDYDSEGRVIPIEKDCKICLEELSLVGPRTIMKLPCAHNFHKDCLLPWLRRKLSCPTCRGDIHNPLPKKRVPRMMVLYSKQNTQK